MEHGFSKRANKMFETRRKRKVRNRVVIGAGSLVLLLTFQIMMLPALTLTGKSLVCEMKEHIHTNACYKTVLECQEGSREGHSHSEGCYAVSYVCGEVESEGHRHDGSCYSVTCGLEDGPGHEHGESCYGIVCNEEESSGHSHSDACRDVSGELVCGQTESQGHTHDDGCRGLTCGEEAYAAHAHTDACKTLSCGLEESEGHSHSAACEGEATDTLICGLEETEAVESDHIHGSECYRTYLACGLEEHTHVDGCYKVVDGEENAENTEGTTEGGKLLEELLEVPVEIPDYIYDDVLGMGQDMSPLSRSKPTDYSDVMSLTGQVTETENGKYALTLEAIVQDTLEPTSMEKPLDLVMLLDQSTSMYESAMAEETGVISREIFLELAGGAGFVSEKAQQLGYFIARSDDAEDSDGTWYLLQYDHDTNTWLFRERDNEGAEDVSCSIDEIPADINRFYVSRYGKMYDAVLSLAESLANSEADHRMALAGIAGVDEEGSILVNGEEVLPEELAEEDYEAMMISLHEESDLLYEAIDNLTAGHASADPGTAFAAANGIFENASKVDEYGVERQRAVVMITAEGIQAEDEGVSEEIAAVINASCETKNTYGAKVYAVTMAAVEDDFQQYLTSAYPKAMVETADEEEITETESTETTGDTEGIAEETSEEPSEKAEEFEDSGELEILNVTEEDLNDEFAYYSVIKDAGELYNSLETIGEDAVSATVYVDETAVLRTVLSEYFTLANQENIKVSVAPYLGNGAFDEAVESEEIAVQLSYSEDDEDRVEAIYVSGFDFENELLAEPVMTAEDATAAEGEANKESAEAAIEKSAEGHKLIIEIPLTVREGFWGGSGVPVLTEESGLYAGGRQNVLETGSPATDIALSLAVSDEKVAYVPYLQDVDMAGLIDVVSRGKLVTFDGTDFVPEAEWMDDFAMIEWVSVPESISNMESSTGHQFAVRMVPRYATMLMLTDAETESGTESVTRETTIDVQVVKPVFTFQDAVISLGQKPDALYYANHNVLSEKVLWATNTTGNADATATGSADAGTENSEGNTAEQEVPTMTLVDLDSELTLKVEFEYTPMGNVEDQFIFDTPINVAVYQVNDDGSKTNITEHVYFQQAECTLEMHSKEKETFAMHAGNLADAAEFMVHVQTGIELPNTGGIGTTVFYVLGGVLLVGALILLVTKKRMNKTEEEDLDVILDDSNDL